MYFLRLHQRELQNTARLCQPKQLGVESPNCTQPSQHHNPIVGKSPGTCVHLMDTDCENPLFNEQGLFYHRSLPFVVHLGRVRDRTRNHCCVRGVGGSGIRSRFSVLQPPSVLPAFINLLVTRAHKAFGPAPPWGRRWQRCGKRCWRQTAPEVGKSLSETKAGVPC